jgi:hypothetical protein
MIPGITEITDFLEVLFSKASTAQDYLFCDAFRVEFGFVPSILEASLGIYLYRWHPKKFRELSR